MIKHADAWSLSPGPNEIGFGQEASVSDAFNSEEVELMSRALARALKQLEPTELPFNGNEEAAKAVLTRGIIEAVKLGERDEHKLAAHALTYYQMGNG
jgi:hypothetical protein